MVWFWNPILDLFREVESIIGTLDAYGLEALGEDVSTLNIKPSWHPSNFPFMQSPIVVLDVWVICICNHQMWHEYHVIYVHVFLCVTFFSFNCLGPLTLEWSTYKYVCTHNLKLTYIYIYICIIWYIYAYLIIIHNQYKLSSSRCSKPPKTLNKQKHVKHLTLE